MKSWLRGAHPLFDSSCLEFLSSRRRKMFTWMFHLTCAILLSNPTKMTKLSLWTVITASQCFKGWIKGDFPDRSPLWKLVRLTRNQNGVDAYKGDTVLSSNWTIEWRSVNVLLETHNGEKWKSLALGGTWDLYDGLGNLPYRENENCFGCLSVLLLLVF